MRGIPAGFAIIDCQSCHGKNLPHFHFWPETEGKEILRLSAPQERPHVIHDQFEVFVILEISEVLVNVLVTSVISPDVNELVLIPYQHTEVPETFTVENIFVGVHEP